MGASPPAPSPGGPEPALAGAPETDLSVIVLSWNTADLSLACLASLAQHPYRGPHEVLFVDNASEDGSADRVAAAFPEVRVLRNARNLGWSEGNNVGLRAARGRWLLLLNSDTEVRPRTLDRLVEFLRARPGAGCVGARHVYPDGRLQATCVRFPTLATAVTFDTLLARLPWGRRHLDRYFMRDFDHRSTREVDQVPGSCLLLPREVVRRIGLLDEKLWLYFNDVDLCLRVRAAGLGVWFLPEAEVLHHHHASTRKFSWFAVHWHLDQVAYYRKHFGWRGVLAARLTGLYVAAREVWRLVVLRRAARGSMGRDVRFVVRALARVLTS